MRIRKNVLLLFAKYPEPGMVKTRLTAARGGVFTEEDAARLFESMLLDVCEVCTSAFERMEHEGAHEPDASLAEASGAGRDSRIRAIYTEDGVLDSYKLVVSTAPKADVERMRELVEGAFGTAREIDFISDAGATFDEHYNDAFDQCWDAGADCILSMGADMPALTVFDVMRGFMALHALEGEDTGGITLAPDQEMGVSIVGWTSETNFDHTGVFYNPTGLTVLPAYIEKARRAGLPAIYLPPVPDVDTMADLAHNVTLTGALGYCSQFDGNVSPKRTLQTLRELGCDEIRVPPNELVDPREKIDL